MRPVRVFKIETVPLCAFDVGDVWERMCEY